MPIILDGSPLRRIPSRLEPRQARFLDGIRYSIELADLAYTRLEQTTRAITTASQSGQTPAAAGSNMYPTVVADAWLVVDGVHRLRKLLDKMPGAKKGPTVRGFLAATRVIKDLRDRAQHLDETILRAVEPSVSAWGTVSWLYMPAPRPPWALRAWIYTIVPGIVEGIHPVLKHPGGRLLRGPVALLTLNAYGLSAVLGDVIDSVANVTRAIEDGVSALEQEHATLAPDGASDALLVLELAFDLEDGQRRNDG